MGDHLHTTRRMRPLTDEETKILFSKLAVYIGKNIRFLVDRKDEDYCFRLHKDKVYYVSESIMRKAVTVGKKELLSLGTRVGKFTKTRKFKIQITFLDYLAQYALYKVWIKQSSEMSFLYGNNVHKSGLGRITEGVPQHQGVIVLSMQSVPLGFGVTAKSTEECRALDPSAVVVYHQADVGEYLRGEETL